MSHTVNLFNLSLLADSHCKDLLIWFETSGFRCTIYAGPSLELLLVILFFPCVVEILPLSACWTGFVMCPRISQMVWTWVGQPITLVLGLCSMVYYPALLCPHTWPALLIQVLSIKSPITTGPALLCHPGVVQMSPSWEPQQTKARGSSYKYLKHWWRGISLPPMLTPER